MEVHVPLRRAALACALAAGACSGANVASPMGDASTMDAGSDGAGATETGADATESAGPEAGQADAGGDVARAADVAEADAGPCESGSFGEALDLRCAGLYSDWSSKAVASNMVEFSPGVELWSDGAVKRRWVSLPSGQKIDTSDMNEWVFPVGTKFFKEFRLPVGDASGAIRIETRMLWKQSPTGWYRTTYRWSSDGETSASELTTGQLDANGRGYEVPTRLECNSCHEGRLDGVLGFEALALSLPAASGLTMGALLEGGLLTQAPDAGYSIPGAPVQAAALGWLHMNCGTACHNGGTGLAAGTGFHMRLDVEDLASVEATATYRTGWNVLADFFAIPDASSTYRFRACDLASSAAFYRDSRRDGVGGTPPDTQMPPIDSHAVDDAGLAAVAAWILEGCP